MYLQFSYNHVLSLELTVVGLNPIKEQRARSFTLIALFWLVPGMNLSVISQSQLNKVRGLWNIALTVN